MNRRLKRQASDGATPSEISYAYSAQTLGGRAVIRSIENLTGRIRLIRMAQGYERDVEAGRDFWEVMQERYRLTIDAGPSGLEAVPRTGPLVIVANHPFGICDGLAMGRILSSRRDDFRIVAHKVFHKAKDLERIILPVDFGGDREAQMVNLATRRSAIAHLDAGGAIGIFPGGTVSTAREPFGRPIDPAWRTFTAKMASRPGVTVVPIFFHGGNSRLFQVASHLHVTLRMALLIKEFGRYVDGAVKTTIGDPIDRAEIEARSGDPRALMDYLRRATYSLAPEPLEDLSYGFEFDETLKGNRAA